MSLRERLIDYSKGDDLHHFWKLYARQQAASNCLLRDYYTFRVNRAAQRHGGYVGPGAVFEGKPSLPHGLHGVYISRYAVIGRGCRIYQNVTIGEIDHKAPIIGENCLIGAGAVLVGGIRIGKDVRIGAGAVVCSNVPDHSTVVAQPARVLVRGCGN